jgi:[ribosomal protein S5]-alanine N-acetyltransferase
METSAVKQSRSVDSHVIGTANLTMRAIERRDALDYIGLLTDPEVMKYVGVEAGAIPTTDEITAIVDGAVRGWETRGWGRWSIFEQASKDFVGFTGFRCEEGMPELISVVHERFWGKGYAHEGSRRCIDYAFETLEFDELCAFCRPANARARSMVERLGGRFQGIVDFHGVVGEKYLIQKGTS